MRSPTHGMQMPLVALAAQPQPLELLLSRVVALPVRSVETPMAPQFPPPVHRPVEAAPALIPHEHTPLRRSLDASMQSRQTPVADQRGRHTPMAELRYQEPPFDSRQPPVQASHIATNRFKTESIEASEAMLRRSADAEFAAAACWWEVGIAAALQRRARSKPPTDT